MKVEEHSMLLYLLDALQIAPEKSERLFSIAESSDASEDYKHALFRLRRVMPTRENFQQVGNQLKIEIS